MKLLPALIFCLLFTWPARAADASRRDPRQVEMIYQNVLSGKTLDERRTRLALRFGTDDFDAFAVLTRLALGDDPELARMACEIFSTAWINARFARLPEIADDVQKLRPALLALYFSVDGELAYTLRSGVFKAGVDQAVIAAVTQKASRGTPVEQMRALILLGSIAPKHPSITAANDAPSAAVRHVSGILSGRVKPPKDWDFAAFLAGEAFDPRAPVPRDPRSPSPTQVADDLRRATDMLTSGRFAGASHRRDLARFINNAGDAAAPFYIELLKTTDDDVFAEFAKPPQAALPELTKLLDDTNPRTLVRAIHGLTGRVTRVNRLCELLEHPDQAVRKAAARALYSSEGLAFVGVATRANSDLATDILPGNSRAPVMPDQSVLLRFPGLKVIRPELAAAEPPWAGHVAVAAGQGRSPTFAVALILLSAILCGWVAFLVAGARSLRRGTPRRQDADAVNAI